MLVLEYTRIDPDLRGSRHLESQLLPESRRKGGGSDLLRRRAQHRQLPNSKVRRNIKEKRHGPSVPT